MESLLYSLGSLSILIGSSIILHVWTFFGYTTLFGAKHLNRYGALFFLLGLIAFIFANRSTKERKADNQRKEERTRLPSE